MNQKAERLGAFGRVSPMDLAIIMRDHPRCAYCQIELEPLQGGFDHVLAFNKGGRNDPTNIVRCCATCNREKFTKTPAELDAYRASERVCPIDGIVFRPRWSELQAGRGKYCSRRCAAKSRWI